jgi:Leucine-rich repeat (LRR) protein
VSHKLKQYIDKYEALGYGEDHLLFAAHAAFPTGVTPHLLYQIWANFSVIPGRNEGINPVVVSDFLLSNLCRETSLGIFEINGSIRRKLLDKLEADPRFGRKRLEELAYFLYQYIQKSAQEEDYSVFREAQYWTALSVIAPQKAAQEIGKILGDKIGQSDQGEILRINSLLEQIGQEDQSFSNLLNYSRGLKDGLLDRPQAAQEAFSKVMVISPEETDAETFALKIPLMRSLVDPATNFIKAPTAAERKALVLIEEATDTLNLSNIAGLKRIPEAVKNLTSLRELTVNGSDLIEVPTFLQEMNSLEVLMLTHNAITHLPASLPRGLKYLDLRYNQVNRLDRGIFLLPELETLNLTENQLEIMPDTILDAPESLSVLETAGNPWLNLPTDFNFPTSVEQLHDEWQLIESQIESIRLINIGTRQGDLFLDIQDQFRPWVEDQVLAIATEETQLRFALYPSRDDFSPTYRGVPVLYLTGDNFELINDSSGEDRSVLSPEQLVRLWQPLKEMVNLVVLNISESLAYANALVEAGFKAVIASDLSLRERQRLNFQQQFFASLQSGVDLKTAYNRSVNGGPIQKGNFKQQSKSQSNVYSEGPDLSLELHSWRIIENTEGPQTDWSWKLPPLDDPVEKNDAAVKLEAQKNAIKKLIQDGKMDAVLNQLESIISTDSELNLDFVVLKGRYNSMYRNEQVGRISAENANIERNQIIQSILTLLDDLTSKDIRVEGTSDVEQNAADISSNPLLDAWKTDMKSQLAGADIEIYLDEIEAKIQIESPTYDNLVIISALFHKKLSDFNNGLIKEEAFSLEKETTRSKLLELVDQVPDNAYEISRAEIASDLLTQVQFSLKTNLRKFQMEAIWASFKDNLKPNLVNYDGYLLAGRYRQYEKNSTRNTLSNENDDLTIRGIITDTFTFIDQLEVLQLNPVNTLSPNYLSPSGLFVQNVLQLLAANEVEKALFYFNDYTVSTPDFMERFNKWIEAYDGNEAKQQEGGEAYQLYLMLRNQALQDFKVFLEDVENDDLLIENFLDKRREDLQNDIDSLNSQKYFDEAQMAALQSELKLIDDIKRQQTRMNWQQVRSLYFMIAENEVLNAAETLFKDAYVIDEKLAQQAQQLYDRLNQLERDREKMGFAAWQKERSSLIEGLLLTIRELWQPQVPKQTLRDPDLLQYVRTTVERQIEAGELKKTFTYLLNSLEPTSGLMEDTVDLSARYYALEDAQYREDIDHASVLEQLNSSARYLQNLVQDESLALQSNFVSDELQRVAQELDRLSRQGKSKKFNIRKDGEYQDLQAARDFLRKH